MWRERTTRQSNRALKEEQSIISKDCQASDGIIDFFVKKSRLKRSGKIVFTLYRKKVLP